MITTCILIGFIAFMEVITLSVYGWFVSKQIEDVFMNLDESKLRLSGSILNIGNERDLPYITNLGFSLLSQYYINEIGTIPRWSPLHKKVKRYYAVAIKNSLRF